MASRTQKAKGKASRQGQKAKRQQARLLRRSQRVDITQGFGSDPPPETGFNSPTRLRSVRLLRDSEEEG
jgi:hypothetical protein